MKILFKWLFIAITIILGPLGLHSADISHWHTNGSMFSIEFVATPICVRGDTVVGIPRGESREIAINNQNGKLTLTYSRISGMKERLVDDLFVEQYGGQVVESKTWTLSLTLKDTKIKGDEKIYRFTGTANCNGKSEPCTFNVIVNKGNPNEEVMDIFGSNDASVYYDRYEIRIGSLKWSSNDPTNLFSEVVPEAKKVQNSLLSFLLKKSNKVTNSKSSSNKPPLKK